MEDHQVVSREEWLVARQEYLAEEKEFTRLRDQSSLALLSLRRVHRLLGWTAGAHNH